MTVNNQLKPNPQPEFTHRSERESFGEKIRKLRKKREWTLEALAERSGISFSTISKAERGIISLTYDNILKLAFAFGVDMSQLLSDTDDDDLSYLVTLERKDKSKKIENEYYVMNMLCSARAKKRMVPVYAIIKAHSVEEFKKYISHPGEEFVYVLEGELTFQIEGQEPRFLEPGDCLYFDSGLGHAYLSTGEAETRLLVVCWHPATTEVVDAGVQSRLM
jgi:transcriptional regulator with XRE-family HTH domain